MTFNKVSIYIYNKGRVEWYCHFNWMTSFHRYSIKNILNFTPEILIFL